MERFSGFRLFFTDYKMEPYYLVAAKRMMGTEELEDSLVLMLSETDRRVRLGHDGQAGLRSSQVIAGIIATWEAVQ